MASSSWFGLRSGPVRGWTVDVVAAGLATAFLVLATGHIAVTGDEHQLDAFAYVLLVVAGVSVGTCRRWPKLTLAVVTVVLGAYIVGRYVGGPIYVVGWVALFHLSLRTDRRTALIGAGALCAVLSATSLIVRGDAPLLHLVFLGWSAAAVFVGDALRNRRSYLGELEERNRSLEQTREEEARRRVAEDRLRIARDLHDSVAHAMATINVQAGVAAHVLDRRPGAVKPALDAIQHASREVLDELAAMVRVLRDEDDGASRAPTPGVAQIPELVDAAGAAHLPVTLETVGPVDAVGPAVGTAAYRIVQESLTNVMRHAPGAMTRVVLRRAPDRSLRLEVCNDDLVAEPGARAAGNGSGVGIRGMRERAETTGGVLEVGPRVEGGFQVVATWPTT
jgi:signal transduction histidine kinase